MNPSPTTQDLQSACEALSFGGIIAYPTEAVFGLGCDPMNTEALDRLIALKARALGKGFILVAAEWSQLQAFVAPVPPDLLTQAQSTWPGPHTWVFPAQSNIPKQLCGELPGIAVRISAHPIVQALCKNYGSAIVSTSANLSGQPPIRDASTVSMLFGENLAFVLPGKTGELTRPTEIRDVLTGKLFRACC